MAEAVRQAECVWDGNLTDGSGTVTVGSGAFDPFAVTWASRAERPDGRTSPEELLAAAHAACYAMALANTLNEAGNPPERLAVDAACTLDVGTGITTMDLRVRGHVPGMDASQFERLARDGERSCPVSNALRANLEIRLDAALGE